MYTKNNQDRMQYHEIMDKVKKAIRRAKKGFSRQFCKGIELNQHGKQYNALWNKIKALTRKNQIQMLKKDLDNKKIK